ncbi:MAG: hypothetical protein JSR58_03435 [Verrucomicrobia bacterium]|nr:hypothetical protein [Verrucomicrobiota bacterium]
MTINTLSNTLRAEIFSWTPDTALRLVCKLWKETFDSQDFKAIMGQIYERWIRRNPLWEAIQLKWSSLLHVPLHIDSELCGKLSFPQRMGKIVKFIFLQNPALIALARRHILRNNPSSLHLQMKEHLGESADKTQAQSDIRIMLRDQIVNDIYTNSDSALIQIVKVPKQVTISDWVRSLFPKKVKDQPLDGNLCVERLEILCSAQMTELRRLEFAFKGFK